MTIRTDYPQAGGDTYNPNFSEYSVAERASDALQRRDRYRDEQEAKRRGTSEAPAPTRQMMRVRLAKPGSRLPDGQGGWFGDRVFEVSRSDVYINRRLMDGSLIKVDDGEISARGAPPPVPVTVEPVNEPAPTPAPAATSEPASASAATKNGKK
jgi:hypothetical protein